MISAGIAEDCSAGKEQHDQVTRYLVVPCRNEENHRLNRQVSGEVVRMAWQSTVGPPTAEMPQGQIHREVRRCHGTLRERRKILKDRKCQSLLLKLFS